MKSFPAPKTLAVASKNISKSSHNHKGLGLHQPDQKQYTTKELALAVAAPANQAMQLLVNHAVMAMKQKDPTFSLTYGKNDKHFAKMLGNALEYALAGHNINIKVATDGVEKGLDQAKGKLALGSTNLTKGLALVK